MPLCGNTVRLLFEPDMSRRQNSRKVQRRQGNTGKAAAKTLLRHTRCRGRRVPAPTVQLITAATVNSPLSVIALISLPCTARPCPAERPRRTGRPCRKFPPPAAQLITAVTVNSPLSVIALISLPCTARPCLAERPRRTGCPCRKSPRLPLCTENGKPPPDPTGTAAVPDNRRHITPFL